MATAFKFLYPDKIEYRLHDEDRSAALPDIYRGLRDLLNPVFRTEDRLKTDPGLLQAPTQDYAAEVYVTDCGIAFVQLTGRISTGLEHRLLEGRHDYLDRLLVGVCPVNPMLERFMQETTAKYGIALNTRTI